MFPGGKALGLFKMRTPRGERAVSVERSALRAQSPLVVKVLFQPDMYHSQGGEVPVLSTERSVDQIYAGDQFRAQRLERTEVALSVPLRRLVLRNVIHQHLEAAILAAVVQVESEAAKLQRLAAALVLAGVDAAVERFKKLVVAQKKGVFVDCVVTPVNGRIGRGGRNHQRLLRLGKLIVNPQLEVLGGSIGG